MWLVNEVEMLLVDCQLSLVVIGCEDCTFVLYVCYRRLYDWGYGVYPQSYKRQVNFSFFNLFKFSAAILEKGLSLVPWKTVSKDNPCANKMAISPRLYVVLLLPGVQSWASSISKESNPVKTGLDNWYTFR